jgi:hypothetical protein
MSWQPQRAITHHKTNNFYFSLSLSLYIYESITTGKQLSVQPSLYKHPNKSVCGYKIMETSIHHSLTATLQFREQNSSHLKVEKQEQQVLSQGAKQRQLIYMFV